MAIPLNDNIKLAVGKPSEYKYLTSLNVPYTGTSQVNSLIPLSERHNGLTVKINNVEYWYASGTTNSDLILKSGGSSAIDALNGLTKSGSTILIGGELVRDTIIDGNGFAFYLESIADFRLESFGDIDLNSNTLFRLQGSELQLDAFDGVSVVSTNGITLNNYGSSTLSMYGNNLELKFDTPVSHSISKLFFDSDGLEINSDARLNLFSQGTVDIESSNVFATVNIKATSLAEDLANVYVSAVDSEGNGSVLSLNNEFASLTQNSNRGFGIDNTFGVSIVSSPENRTV